MATHRNLFDRQGRELLWFFVLLALLVVLPTVGMFILLAKTMENERLVLRQRLEVIHEEQLTEAGERLAQYLANPIYPEIQSERTSRNHFTEWLKVSQADTLVLTDEEGSVRFPVKPQPTGYPVDWSEGERLEFQEQSFGEAVKFYRDAFTKAKKLSVKSQALQRVLRCLVKAGSPASTIGEIYQELEELGPSRDRLGHAILPYVQLYLLQHRENLTPELARHLEKRLLFQLEEVLELTTEQRSFILLRLSELGISCVVSHLAEEQSALKLPLHEFNGSVIQQNGSWMVAPPGKRSASLLF
jgi:hypothetical protein